MAAKETRSCCVICDVEWSSNTDKSVCNRGEMYHPGTILSQNKNCSTNENSGQKKDAGAY